MKCYEFIGIINKTGLKEAIFVNAETRSIAELSAQTFAKDIVFIKEHKLSKDW